MFPCGCQPGQRGSWPQAFLTSLWGTSAPAHIKQVRALAWMTAALGSMPPLWPGRADKKAGRGGGP